MYREMVRPPTLKAYRAAQAAMRRLRRPVVRRCQNDCECLAVEITRDDGTRNIEIYQRVGTELIDQASRERFNEAQRRGPQFVAGPRG